MEAVPLWDRISAHDALDDMVTAATPSSWGSLDADGLVRNHAYVVLGTAHIAAGDIRLVKLRNPQGLDKYQGAWSDASADWTAAREAAVKAQHPEWERGANDGLFFMEINDYHSLF